VDVNNVAYGTPPGKGCHRNATIVPYQWDMNLSMLFSAFTMDAAAAMFLLISFLGLIAGILVRWSSDTSWKERPMIK
jgi:hypothetical protein